MINPGDYTLAALNGSTASGQVLTSIQDLQGMKAITLLAQVSSAAASCKVYIQTTLDNGASWVDIACFAVSSSSLTKLLNLSGLTPVTSPVTPTDGAMTDNTCLDGVMGSMLRAKITATGSYSATVRASCR